MKLAMLAVLILPLAILAFPPSPPCCRQRLRRSPTPARTDSAKSSMPILRGGNNGSAFAASTPTRHGSTRRPASPCWSPLLRICRSGARDGRFARRQDRAPSTSAGTVSHRPPAVRRPARRRDPDPRRPAVLPALALGPIVEQAMMSATPSETDPMSKQASAPVVRPAICHRRG